MKKAIILALLLTLTHTTFAEQQGVFLRFYRKNKAENTRDVNRSRMLLPIEVVYDSDTHKISVIGNDTMEAEVFLYSADGALENYSSTLNTDFTVLAPGTYTILIQGDGWNAEGEVEVQ